MTKYCQNPECGKKIREDLDYCSQECLRRHKELRKAKKNQTELSLKGEDDIWLGQQRRKRAMDTILRLAKECCPISFERFVCLVSYKTGLSIRKITEDYLRVLLGVGLLKRDGDSLILGRSNVEVG